MSRTRSRLERIEKEVGRLPVSAEQSAELEERLACRYTILLDIDRRVIHRMLELSGESPGPYCSLRPPPEQIEKIRDVDLSIIIKICNHASKLKHKKTTGV